MAIIAVRGITKFYGGLRALEDVSFEVKQGEIYGCLGPNGSGKTTTIRLLLNFIRATRGEVRLFDQPVSKAGTLIRRRVGYVPGEIGFPENRSGDSLLRFYAGLSQSPAPLREQLCTALEFHPRDRKRKVATYSKGTRQKLAIIQALQHDPDLIILDEPTTGLDPLVQSSLFSVLRELRNRGKTIFFSSHILSEVYNLCDRIAVLREGKLFLDTRTSEFVASAPRLLYLRIPREEQRDMEPVPLFPEATFVRREGDWLVYQVAPAGFGRVLAILSHIQPEDFRFESAIEDAFMGVYRKPGVEGVRFR
jgi:ABC-2 type transport system ATP-binding protein